MMNVAVRTNDRFVAVDGLNIRYLEDGAGVPAILLHGSSLGSSADVFRRNLPALAAGGVRAIAVDLPGFGKSDPASDLSGAARNAFILRFMDELGLERAALIGHSSSGGPAVSIALKNPDRVSHVIVLGTGSLLPPLEANLFHHELITDEELALRHQNSVGRCFEQFVRRHAAAGEDGGIKPSVPLWQRLVELKQPLLLIYGRNDRARAEERATLLKERHPQLDLHFADGCKHLLPWDAADLFHKLAVPFLTR